MSWPDGYEWTGLAKVVDNPFHRTEPAFTCPLDQGFGRLDRTNGHAWTIGERDHLVIALDEPVLDLLLRRRDQRVTKPLSQVHGNQGHDLYGLARAGGLFDQNVLCGPANVGDQSHLIGSQLFGGGIHGGISSGKPAA